jgi:hypothetical protein
VRVFFCCFFGVTDANTRIIHHECVYSTIEVMYLSFRRSKDALLALGFFVLMVVIVFSTLLYVLTFSSRSLTHVDHRQGTLLSAARGTTLSKPSSTRMVIPPSSRLVIPSPNWSYLASSLIANTPVHTGRSMVCHLCPSDLEYLTSSRRRFVIVSE